MICQSCREALTEECRFCPQCGQPALFAPTADPEEDFRIAATGSLAGLARLIPDQKYRPMVASSVASARTTLLASSPVAATPFPARVSVETPPMLFRTQQFQPLLTKANVCRLRHEWNEATDACIAVLRSQPNNRHAHSLLGDIYRDQGKWDDAMQWYRMALELEPTPGDAAKLRALETGKRPRLRAATPTGLLPSPMDALLKTGTTPLMNVSPRRWLRGITIASVLFLASVVTLLGYLQVRRHTLPGGTTRSSGFQSDPTALQRLGQTAPAKASVLRPAASPSSDTGFAPDQPASSTPAPLQQIIKKAQKPKTKAATKTEVAVAPPLDVRPLPDVASEASMGTTASGTAGGYAQAGFSGLERAPSAPETLLPGGLRLLRMDKEASGGSATLFLAAPGALASNLNAASRDLLLRSTFRAARDAAQADGRLGRLTVLISAPASGANNGLLEATLDASTALSANLNASADTLAQQCVSLRWLTSLPDTTADSGSAGNANGL